MAALCGGNGSSMYESVLGFVGAFVAFVPRHNLSWSTMWDLRHVFMLPFLENLKFIGRKAISEAIEERLFGLQECRELAIVGLGGIGKTQIVLQLATAAQLAPTDARPLEQA
ncbi:TPR-like protein [Apiospora arundinis]|uniref:TPR-like protein n=1 Tax=Apiospora arundinis TaxID=335852 RepID=A0ABR2IWZ0_9PEZI